MITTILASDSHLPDINRSAGDFASMAIWNEAGRFDRFCSITVLDGGNPIAAIILHNWHPEAGTIELSGAGSGRWQSRRVLREIFSTCFDVMGCQMVIMRNSARDDRTISNSRRLGFTGILLPRMRGRDEDEWLFTLTDDAWRSCKLYKVPAA